MLEPEGKIRAIIIDDELRARRLLANMINEYCPDIEIVAQCDNVPSGVIEINRQLPDVLFLDIEMPDYSGFELLDFFKKVDFEIIFVTAYSEHAIRAFEVSAIDYLLKPVQIDLLEKAIEKLKQKLAHGNAEHRLEVLKENLRTPEVSKIAVPVNDGLVFINTRDITHIKADGAYALVYTSDGESLLVSKKLKYFEDMLKDHQKFFRVHRSHLINTDYLLKYSRHESMVILENNIELPLARNTKVAFEQFITPGSSSGK